MKIKTMLVDDVDISNFLMKRLLLKLPFEIDTFDFTSPVKAFDSIKQIKPDIIFLDLNMPVMSGWDFLDKMQDGYDNYKVVIVTSSVSVLDKQRAGKYANVINYCDKPITKELLAECIQPLVNANLS